MSGIFYDVLSGDNPYSMLNVKKELNVKQKPQTSYKL